MEETFLSRLLKNNNKIYIFIVSGCLIGVVILTLVSFMKRGSDSSAGASPSPSGDSLQVYGLGSDLAGSASKQQNIAGPIQNSQALVEPKPTVKASTSPKSSVTAASPSPTETPSPTANPQSTSTPTPTPSPSPTETPSPTPSPS